MILFKDATISYPARNMVITNWNRDQLHFTDLTPQEQDFYYWVNYSRVDPHRFFDSVVKRVIDAYPQLKGENFETLHNDLANAGSLPLFILNPDLIKMAKGHAADIVSHEAQPSHNSTNGDSFSDRFKQKNLKNCGGENLSFGATDPVLLLVLLYLDINVPNLGHRKALLNPGFVETGIGAANYKNGSVFLVQDFSCSQK